MYDYYVYITTNITRTVLYIGVTGNLNQRLGQHWLTENGKAFTARYGVRRLLYFEQFSDINQAIAREKQLKGWARKKKEALIDSRNPTRRFLDGLDD